MTIDTDKVAASNALYELADRFVMFAALPNLNQECVNLAMRVARELSTKALAVLRGNTTVEWAYQTEQAGDLLIRQMLENHP